MTAGISIENISKHFGETAALDNVSLEVRAGELVALLGPSGSGKTTLLRIVAGLEQAERGRLAIGGIDATDLPPRERGIGFVFQHYALFRHMSVFDNIAFGLTVRPRARRPAKTAIAARVRELLSLVQLEGLEKRFPAQLSGGQRQRVALARALAVEPRVLLLDEPFGALDAKVRLELRHWLIELQDRLGITTVFVTHDQEEALELADRVAILNAGRIEQIGPPRSVYDKPESGFVLEFLGEVNRLPARIEAGRAVLPFGADGIDAEGLPDGAACAYVRPHEVVLEPPALGRDRAATVRSLSVIGPRTRVHLVADDQDIEADVDRAVTDALGLAPGSRVGVRFQTVRLFPAA
jgi:sulfate transport system ATP-binding protein